MDDRQLASHVADGGRLRALVLELWQRTRMDWGFITDRLATTFRKETWIGSHERRFVSETLYGWSATYGESTSHSSARAG